MVVTRMSGARTRGLPFALVAKSEPVKRNGKLRIPLPFEDALKAATEVPAEKLTPPGGSKRKPRRKRGQAGSKKPSR